MVVLEVVVVVVGGMVEVVVLVVVVVVEGDVVELVVVVLVEVDVVEVDTVVVVVGGVVVEVVDGPPAASKAPKSGARPAQNAAQCTGIPLVKVTGASTVTVFSVTATTVRSAAPMRSTSGSAS